jgi:hypothetical protein
MSTHAFRPLFAGALLAICLAPAGAAQEPSSPSLPSLDTPHALRMEDRHLREDLARARQDQGSVGSAAKELERLLLPHLDQREQAVFRPLGLLRALARNEPSPDTTQAMALVDQVERDLPRLVQEHRALYDANKRLIDAANREHKPQYLDLSDRLWVHMRMEEEVLYPTVMLVGRYLRLQEDARHRPTARSSR